MAKHLYDDCLYQIFLHVDPLQLLSDCMMVSKLWYNNARRVSLNLDFSANLGMVLYSIEKIEGRNKAQNTTLINFDISNMFSCQYLERLESLNLSFNRIGCEGAKLISECKYLVNLRELILNGCNITTDGFEYLLKSSTVISTKLTGLDLSRNGLGNNNVKMLIENAFKLENLNYLYVSGNNVTMDGFVALLCGSLKSLKELNLDFNDIDEYEISESSIPDIGLQVLNLSHTFISDYHLSILCNKLKKLQKLYLRSHNFSENFKQVLDKLPELWYLDISHRRISPEILTSLHSCHNLKTLVMNNCRLKDCDSLLNENCLNSLENLHLLGNQFTCDSIISIKEAALKRGIDVTLEASLPKLTSQNKNKQLLQKMLDLKINKLKSNILIADQDVSGVLSQFDTIEVSEERSSSLNNLTSIPPLDYLKCVKVINMYGCKIGDQGFKLLFTNNCMSNLKELLLGENGIKQIPTPEECHPNLKSLTNLDLKYNFIGDEGVYQIVNNPYLSNLRKLQVEINGITIEGVKHIVSSPYMSKLCVLNLDGNGGGDINNIPNRIGDEGFELLMNSNLNNLWYLCVSDNGLGNASAKTLANHQGVRNLVDLIMFENEFNDEAIPYLTSLSIRKFLTLRILYHQISPEGVDQIEKSAAFQNLSYSI